MKKKILLALSVLFLLAAVAGCNSQQSTEPETQSMSETTPEVEEPEIPPIVADLQRKIDVALKSNPSYSDLMEIKKEVDTLTISERVQLQHYNSIKKLLALSPEDVACIYTVNQLKGRLKNPLSLTLISANTVMDSTGDKNTIAVKIDYTASNSFGGEVKNSYYCLLYPPQFDSSTQQWYCEMDEVCASQYRLELLGESTGPNLSAAIYETDILYEINARESIDIDKIMDNLDLDITESIGSNKP